MILVAMETILAGNYEVLFSKMCVHVFIKWPGTASVQQLELNHISLKSAGYQHSVKECGVCITSLQVEL